MYIHLSLVSSPKNRRKDVSARWNRRRGRSRRCSRPLLSRGGTPVRASHAAGCRLGPGDSRPKGRSRWSEAALRHGWEWGADCPCSTPSGLNWTCSQKVIPALAERFQVYALDYPGHGYSDIPEMYRVGSRRGHYVALMSLVRHWPEWEQARREYGAIQRPVLLLYGGEDWSHEPERESNHRAIPGSRMRITPNAGHFFALDDPDELIRSIREFSDLLREPATAVRP